MNPIVSVLQLMRTGPVIPVIVIEKLEHAVPLARALVAGGVRVLEVTLRTAVAIEAVEAIARQVEGAIVGVGTITRPDDFARSIEAGALFGVSPGLTPVLVEAAKASGLPLLPGAMTPSDSATGVAAPGTAAAGAPNGEAIAVSATGAAVCRAAI